MDFPHRRQSNNINRELKSDMFGTSGPRSGETFGTPHNCRAESLSVSPTIDDFGAPPAMLVDSALHVLSANRRAREVLPVQGEAGLLRLLAGSPNGGAARHALREAVARNEGQICLVECATGAGLICRATPVRRGADPAALIILMPLRTTNDDVIPHLRSIYGLTSREAEVAARVGAGFDVVEIARDRQVSLHTLRTMLASIKAKMELSRMTEIAARVSSIAAACSMF